jgi:signal transduction histidine kinase
MSRRPLCGGIAHGEAESFSTEYPCHSPREERWFKVDVSPFGGEGKGAVIAHTNISELHRAEVELRASLEAKNRMMGMLAHDLRNPLGALSGFAEFMEMSEA